MPASRLAGAALLILLAGLLTGAALASSPSGRIEAPLPPEPAATLADPVAWAAAIALPPFDAVVPSDEITRLADPHTDIPTRPRIDVLVYTVQSGDTPTGIAARFNLRPESILWANPALSADAGTLRVGQELNILPVDGVLHYVEPGDTLERVQLLYGTPIDEIVAYPGNGLPEAGPYTLETGQKIIVPNGRKPIVWKEPGPKVVPGRGRRSPGFYKGPLVNLGTGRFIWPVAGRVITQYFWGGHPAIDVDTTMDEPIYASDSGTVIFSGWDNTGYGYLIIVDHGNDYWTYYGHNNSLLVRVGEGVVQGQTIALSGSTGNSTGAHIDFRIRWRAAEFLNPLNFLP